MADKKFIWICGDSWSVPNYEFPVPGYRAQHHVSEFLADRNHLVYNFGRPGHGNMHSVGQADYHTNLVANKPNVPKPDLIVWFHTAIIRDCHSEKITHELFSETASKIYSAYSDMVRKSGAKLIVIEGHAPVSEHEFFNYLNPDIFIRNWRGKILGMPELPQSHWYCEARRLEKSWLTTEQKLSETHVLTQIADAVSSRPDLFPDESHPGDIPNIQLSLKIVEYLENLK